MLITTLVLLILGYLFGCLHGSLLAQKLSGVDLKATGLKNAGASNATIILGKKLGALVAIIDIGKGFIFIVLTRFYTMYAAFDDYTVWLCIFISGAAVIIGHIFPFHMKFNGGKGTATMIGVLFAMDWKMGLIGFTLFIGVALLTDYLIKGVLVLYVTFLTFSIWYVPGIVPVLIAVLLFLLSFNKHIENIQRIKSGEEKRISAVFAKKKIDTH